MGQSQELRLDFHAITPTGGADWETGGEGRLMFHCNGLHAARWDGQQKGDPWDQACPRLWRGNIWVDQQEPARSSPSKRSPWLAEAGRHPGTVAYASRFQMAGDWGSPGLAACALWHAWRAAVLGELEGELGAEQPVPCQKAQRCFLASQHPWSKTAPSFGVIICCPKDAPTAWKVHEGSRSPKPFCLGEPLLRDALQTHTGLPQRLSKLLQLLKTLSKASRSVSGTREREGGPKNQGRA